MIRIKNVSVPTVIVLFIFSLISAPSLSFARSGPDTGSGKQPGSAVSGGEKTLQSSPNTNDKKSGPPQATTEGTNGIEPSSPSKGTSLSATATGTPPPPPPPTSTTSTPPPTSTTSTPPPTSTTGTNGIQPSSPPMGTSLSTTASTSATNSTIAGGNATLPIADPNKVLPAGVTIIPGTWPKEGTPQACVMKQVAQGLPLTQALENCNKIPPTATIPPNPIDPSGGFGITPTTTGVPSGGVKCSSVHSGGVNPKTSEGNPSLRVQTVPGEKGPIRSEGSIAMKEDLESWKLFFHIELALAVEAIAGPVGTAVEVFFLGVPGTEHPDPNAEPFDCADVANALAYCQKIGYSTTECQRIPHCGLGEGGGFVDPAQRVAMSSASSSGGLKGNAGKNCFTIDKKDEKHLDIMACASAVKQFVPGEEQCKDTGMKGDVVRYGIYWHTIRSDGQKYDPCNDPRALTDECGSLESHTVSFISLPLDTALRNQALKEACSKVPSHQPYSLCNLIPIPTTLNPTPPPSPTPSGPKRTAGVVGQ